MTDVDRDPRRNPEPTTGRAPRPDPGVPEEGSAQRRAPKLPDVLSRVRTELSGLVGLPVEGISRVDRSDAGWVLGVEVLELSRVPRSTDLLASYEVDTDGDGCVTGWRRMRRYTRGAQGT